MCQLENKPAFCTELDFQIFQILNWKFINIKQININEYFWSEQKDNHRSEITLDKEINVKGEKGGIHTCQYENIISS